MNTILMTSCLFKDGYFHTLRDEEECYEYMGVIDGRISYLGNTNPGNYLHEVSLDGMHVFPALVDSHLHLLYTMVLAASSFVLCEIGEDGIRPDSLDGIRERVTRRAALCGPDEILVGNQYIPSGIREKRLPNREELDAWTGGKKIVIYSIDGHSSAMSTAMLNALGIIREGHSGILSGKDHEFIQGKVMDLIGKSITPGKLARGIANFTNQCIDYGIGTVCAMDGNGDVPEDPLTVLLAKIAGRMDIGVRLYPQFMDLKQAGKFRKYQRRPRVGGCGVWEMDGSVGSHSAAFYQPYRDTGAQGACYYTQSEVSEKLQKAQDAGYQISCHAIGEAAIDRVLAGYEQMQIKRMHRIDHFEFPTAEAVEKVSRMNLALTVQPGFSWIDKRYLKSYEQNLPSDLVRQQIPLKTLTERGVCICGSSDSPVQEINPYVQMLGMVDFYLPEESLTMYQALRTYTVNAAEMLGEAEERGTLEVGKRADFMVLKENLLRMEPASLSGVRTEGLYLNGKKKKKKKGTVIELAAMFLKAPHKI